MNKIKGRQKPSVSNTALRPVSDADLSAGQIDQVIADARRQRERHIVQLLMGFGRSFA